MILKASSGSQTGVGIVIVESMRSLHPTVQMLSLLSKNIEVSGLDWFKYRENCPKLIAKVQAEVFRLFAEEKIRSHVDQRIPFKRISEAVELIRERKVIGRIALTWP